MRQFKFLPLELEDSTVTLAMADPLDFETVNTARLFTKLQVRTAIAAEQEILDAIDKYYGESEQNVAVVEGDTAELNEEIEHLRDAIAASLTRRGGVVCWGWAGGHGSLGDVQLAWSVTAFAANRRLAEWQRVAISIGGTRNRLDVIHMTEQAIGNDTPAAAVAQVETGRQVPAHVLQRHVAQDVVPDLVELAVGPGPARRIERLAP